MWEVSERGVSELFSVCEYVGLLIAYFVKISKEGKRRDAVEESFEMKCPITAEESQQLANENNIK